jgi:hypothetical protein
LADGDVIDFSDRMTPVCEVVGLNSVMTLLTPAESVGAGVYYTRNASDYGVVIRSLKERSGGAPIGDRSAYMAVRPWIGEATARQKAFIIL